MRIARSVLLPCLVVAAMVVPASAVADSSTIGHIFPSGDHVLPGGTLIVLGGQLDPGATVTLRLRTPAGDADLGETTVAPDGTINFSTRVPASTVLGYATLIATDRAGTEWSAAVLIGERPEGPPSDPGGGLTFNQSTIAFAMLGAGLVVFVVAGVMYLRARTKGSTSTD